MVVRQHNYRYNRNFIILHMLTSALMCGWGVVIDQLEILSPEGKEVFYVRVDLHRGQHAWFACQLLPGLVDVVHVEVHVAEGVDEITRLEARTPAPPSW